MKKNDTIPGGSRKPAAHKSKPVVLTMLDILIVILGIVAVFCMIIMIAFFREERDRGYSKYSLQSSISMQQYQRTVQMSNSNRDMGIGLGDPEYEEYYAVADYFEAEFYVQLYNEAGETQRAKMWEEKKNTAAGKMGVLAPEKEKITEYLKVNR